MSILKKIIILVFLFIFMVLAGTLILKIFDMILHLGYENIWLSGLDVGLGAFIFMIILNVYQNKRKK